MTHSQNIADRSCINASTLCETLALGSSCSVYH
uniref:Uncharacterized protein n=1 Tax=Anguilla anguilla TaxID=7936 RepID=A0A0E9PCM3_ANGAN